MNALVQNTQVTKKLYKSFSTAINTFGTVPEKLNKIREKSKEKSDLDAITCPITGALNREGLCKLFDNIVPSALQKLSVVVIELDYMDELEQKLSQRALNKLFKKVVTEVNNTCRNTDIISRCNNTDLVLVCPETSLQQASDVAFNLRKNIRSNIAINGLSFSCSTGITKVNGCSILELITKTKKALYNKSNKGRNNSYVSTTIGFEAANYQPAHKSLNGGANLPKDVLSRVQLRNYLDSTATADLDKTCLVFIEINDFKKIYKQHSQSTSVEVLNSFIEVVNEIGKPYNTLAQWSSTEYILICPSTTVYAAFDISNEIKTRIKDRQWQSEIKMTCSTEIYDATPVDINVHSLKDTLTVKTVAKSTLKTHNTRKPIDKSEMICPDTGLLNSIGLGDYFDNSTTTAIEKTSVVFLNIDYSAVADKDYAKFICNSVLKTFLTEMNKGRENSLTLGRWSEKEYLLICPETSLSQANIIAAEIQATTQNRTRLKEVEVTCNTEAWDKNCGEAPAKTKVIKSTEASTIHAA